MPTTISNPCTGEVVTVLRDASTTIRQDKQTRKKRNKDKYAGPEDKLEMTLARTADEVEKLFLECVEDDEQFAHFDDMSEARMRSIKDEAIEVKGAIKYTIAIDTKKGVREADKLEVKVEKIGNAARKVLEDFRLLLLRQAARRRLSSSQTSAPAPAIFPQAAELSAVHSSQDALSPRYDGGVESLDRHLTSALENPLPLFRPPSYAAYSRPSSTPSSTQRGQTLARDAISPTLETDTIDLLRTGMPRASTCSASGSVDSSTSHILGLGASHTSRATGASHLLSMSIPAHATGGFGQPHVRPGIIRQGSTASYSTAMSSGSETSHHHLSSPQSILSTSPGRPEVDAPRTRRFSSSQSSTLPPRTATTSSESAPGHKIRGAPSRANGWWGFCKGAWDIQDSSPKALVVGQTLIGINGQYRRYIECGVSGCTFQGPQMDTHAKKPSPDNRIYTDPGTGIRFRWSYLAKSHQRCTEWNTGKVIHPSKQRYGCLFCVADGNYSPSLTGVDTLLNHVMHFHTDTENAMTATTMTRNNVICGRLALPEEDFDLNIPRSFGEKEAAEARMSKLGAAMEVVEIGDGMPRTPELEG